MTINFNFGGNDLLFLGTHITKDRGVEYSFVEQKFNIGDKVVVVKCATDGDFYTQTNLGQTGMICSIEYDPTLYHGIDTLYHVSFDNGEKFRYKKDNLQKVVEPKFKVGDRVRAPLTSCVGSKKELGIISDVFVSDLYRCEHYRITLDTGQYLYYLPEEIEKVEENEMNNVHKFNVGDEVIVIGKDKLYNSDLMSKYIGSYGVVTRDGFDLTYGEPGYVVQFSDSTSWSYLESSLMRSCRTDVNFEYRQTEALKPEPRIPQASEMFERVDPKITHSATITLANGRQVIIPDPDPKLWTLDKTIKFDKVAEVFANICMPYTPAGKCDEDVYSLSGEVILKKDAEGIALCDPFDYHIQHEQGKCFLKDMARIINETIDEPPFTHRFSCVTEVRQWFRKPVEEDRYQSVLPALSVLW